MDGTEYTVQEEHLNVFTHALGMLLGVVSAFFLVGKALSLGGVVPVIGVAVYLFGMMLSYSVSTFYHGAKFSSRRLLLRKFDHASIYIHISATYTPIILMTLLDVGWWGISILTFVWLAAIAGVIVSLNGLKDHSNIETLCYVLLGCSILAAIQPLYEHLQLQDNLRVLWWLIAGGVFYIIGALFYSFHKKEYMHTVFHVFILFGSVCHILAIWYCLM